MITITKTAWYTLCVEADTKAEALPRAHNRKRIRTKYNHIIKGLEALTENDGCAPEIGDMLIIRENVNLGTNTWPEMCEQTDIIRVAKLHAKTVRDPYGNLINLNRIIARLVD